MIIHNNTTPLETMHQTVQKSLRAAFQHYIGEPPTKSQLQTLQKHVEKILQNLPQNIIITFGE